MSVAWQLGLVVALVALNGAFAGTEMALVSLRETQLTRLEGRSTAGRVLAGLARDPNRFLATIQIGITLAGFLASATAAVSLSAPLAAVLEPLDGAAEPAAIVVVTLTLAFLTLVFGELVPKRVAMQHAERWALVAALPLDFLARITRPAVWALSVATDAAVRLLGGDPSRGRQEVTEEEIRDMVAAHISLSPDERQVISGAMEIGERTLKEVLVPRPSVVALPAATPIAAAIERIVESGHTRVPVYGTTLDDVLGAVHLRDLVGKEGQLSDALKPLPMYPDSLLVLTALRRLQSERQHMAMVIDEHGGVAGLVTTEDLVEEIVGEMYDEQDRDVISVTRAADGALVLPGTFPIHDLPDVGIDLPDGPYATLAGFILDRLGHIPVEGERVEAFGWQMRVAEVRRQAIREVQVLPLHNNIQSGE